MVSKSFVPPLWPPKSKWDIPCAFFLSFRLGGTEPKATGQPGGHVEFALIISSCRICLCGSYDATWARNHKEKSKYWGLQMNILTSAVSPEMFCLCDTVQKITFLLITAWKYLYNLTMQLIGFNGIYTPKSLGACSLCRSRVETWGTFPKELLKHC